MMGKMLRRFAAMVVLPGLVLLGFGLRALQQDRNTTEQQIKDRIQRDAELAARAMDQQLVNWQQFRTDGVTISTAPPVRVTPASRVAYEPGGLTPDAIDESPIAEAEQQEEVLGNPAAAIPLYQDATASEDAGLRAAALLRLGASYRKTGRLSEARQTYRELSGMTGQRIGGVETELIARFELCLMGAEDRARLYHDLVAGRWRLDKARYLFYSETARAWANEADDSRRTEQDKLALSATIEDYLDHPRKSVGNYLVFRDADEILIVPSAILRSRLEQFVNLDPEVRVRLVTAERPNSGAAYSALSEAGVPWLTEAAPADPARLQSASEQRRQIYLAMLLLVFAMLMVGSYVTARAVKQQLEIARLKSDFVATVSHEFRSPLTAIQQLSELLQRGRAPTEEKRQEYYALISRESGRLARLVENLLDFSSIEGGRKEYHFDRFDPAAWLREVVSSFPKGPVSLSVPSELPPILGDRIALTSAVGNLLDNAVKYSPPGAPVVCEAEASNGELTIRVTDRGFGIDPEDRDHVFDRFYRGKGEISRQVKGTGVGLSLVREIVKAHGGAVDFESRLGVGSVFRIRLKTI